MDFIQMTRRKICYLYSMRAMHVDSLPNQLFLALYACSPTSNLQFISYQDFIFQIKKLRERARWAVCMARICVGWLVAITLHNPCSLLQPVFSCGGSRSGNKNHSSHRHRRRRCQTLHQTEKAKREIDLFLASNIKRYKTVVVFLTMVNQTFIRAKSISVKVVCTDNTRLPHGWLCRDFCTP